MGSGDHVPARGNRFESRFNGYLEDHEGQSSFGNCSPAGADAGNGHHPALLAQSRESGSAIWVNLIAYNEEDSGEDLFR